MKSGNNREGFLYLIIDANTDLPRYVADTTTEAIAWLQCSSRTLMKMLHQGVVYKGFKCERVLDS